MDVDVLSEGYRCELRKNPDGSWFAKCPDLPGCMTEADTADEAVKALNEAAQDWIDERRESGLPIPEPMVEPVHSGKLVLRLPKSIHGRLAQLAKWEGVSLNSFMSIVLAERVGLSHATPQAAAILDETRSLLRDFKGAANRALTDVSSSTVFVPGSAIMGQPLVTYADLAWNPEPRIAGPRKDEGFVTTEANVVEFKQVGGQ